MFCLAVSIISLDRTSLGHGDILKFLSPTSKTIRENWQMLSSRLQSFIIARYKQALFYKYVISCCGKIHFKKITSLNKITI